MSSPQHNGAQNQLTGGVPAARERIRLIGQTGADANAAVCRYDFEDDVENGVNHGVAFEIGNLDAGYEEYGNGEPPQIVCELAPDLVTYELGPGVFRG